MDPETIFKVLGASLNAAMEVTSGGPGPAPRLTLDAIDDAIAKRTDPIALDLLRGLHLTRDELADARKASADGLANLRASVLDLAALQKAHVEALLALTEVVRLLSATEVADRSPEPATAPEPAPDPAAVLADRHNQRIARLVAFVRAKPTLYGTREERALKALARTSLEVFFGELDLDDCLLTLASEVVGFNRALRDAAREHCVTAAFLAESTGLRQADVAAFLGGAVVAKTGPALALAVALDLEVHVRPRVRSAALPDQPRPGHLKVLNP